jgi:Cys-rich protein (TIGR01571 family)
MDQNQQHNQYPPPNQAPYPPPNQAPYQVPNQAPYQPGYGYAPPPQQQQQQQTTVIINQPQATGIQKGQPQNVRRWTTELFGCFEDCGGCLYCYFCYPCFMCSLAGKMDECCCGPCCCPGLFTSSMRTKVRAQYGITGSIFEDVMCIAFCEPCAMHQIHRQLNNLDKLN